MVNVERVEKQRVSRQRENEKVERLFRIDDNILGYNLDGQRVFVRCQQNERAFDVYIALPFVKGMTERETGRTMIILGSEAHHGEAMVKQFPGAVWNDVEDQRSYGNTIRWINVGDTTQGFIGMDYNPNAAADKGVATSLDDVYFVARTLVGIGYDTRKRLFLLKPPYIVEREEGKVLRQRGLNTLDDYCRHH